MKKITCVFILAVIIGLVSCDSSNQKEQIQFEKINLENKNLSNLTSMYIVALDTVMHMDKALNHDMEYISIDFKTLKDVKEKDIKDIQKYFETKYKVKILSYSVIECYQKGLGSENSLMLNGIVLSIDEETEISENDASLNVSKYRSGNGAIGVGLKLNKVNGEWTVECAGEQWTS